MGLRAATSLYRQVRGIASDRVGERSRRKSLSKETTFAQDVSDARVLRDLAATVATTARQEGIGGRTVTLKIRFQGFETHTRQQRLLQCSADARTLFAAGWALYEAGRWHGRPVRLIGLGIADLGPPDPIQPDLFDSGGHRPPDSARERRLAVTIDRIHARFGATALRQGMPVDQPKPADD
jgi:DNA polymerase-4